jgi:arylsulfatase A-like enzyme
VGTTPAVDRFAAESAVFDRHITEAGQSGIAYASIFSGLQADGHGVYDHPRKLSSDVRLITEAFAESGWDVFFWSGHGMADPSLGYAQGVPEDNVRNGPLLADDSFFVDLLRRLSSNPGARALVVTNFTATHLKYTQSEVFFTPSLRSAATLPDAFRSTGLTPKELDRYRDLMFNEMSAFDLRGDPRGTLGRLGFDPSDFPRFVVAMDYLYQCAVNRLDSLFGALVETVDSAGLRESSVIALTSDHGELLWRDNAHFAFSHGWQLAPEVLRVPMILRAPGLGLAPGHRPWVSRSIDVFPTLAAISGVEIGEVLAGVDLSPALLGRAAPPSLDAYSHTALVHENIITRPEYEHSKLKALFPDRSPESMWVSLRRGDMHFKLQRPGPDEEITAMAFDLAADPAETTDVLDRGRMTHTEAIADLELYKARLVAAYREPTDGLLNDRDRVERLKALGYL